MIGRPAAHTLAEVLRFSFPFGGVPLASLGISQVGGPFLGVARIGGVILITWLIFQLGFALAGPAPGVPAFARRFRPGASGSPLGMIGFLAVLCFVGLSFVAPTGSPTGETLSVAAVQGGGEQGTSALEVPSSLVTQRHLDATATIPDDAGIDLVLWPENTIDITTFEDSLYHAGHRRRGRADRRADRRRRHRGHRRRRALHQRADRGRPERRHRRPVREGPSSAVRRIRPAARRCSKRWARRSTRSAVTRSPARVPPSSNCPTARSWRVVISWEVFFGGRAREGVKAGAEAILNPTNGSSYTGTIVQTQQVASSRLRAVENGRWVVQAAPTGFTAVVDADGTVLERTSISEQRVVYTDIELRTGRTWYTDIGDGPIIVALVVVLLISMWFGGRLDRLRGRLGRGPVRTPTADRTP